MEKEFIITEELVKKVQKALLSYRDHIDEQCARTGCMCDLYDSRCSSYPSDVLHDFDSGLKLYTKPFWAGMKLQWVSNKE